MLRFRFTELMNKLFSSILCLQFLISAAAICFSVYRVIYTKTDSQFAGAIIFVFSALIQIFYFCWHGDIAKYKVITISFVPSRKRYFNHFFFFYSRICTQFIHEANEKKKLQFIQNHPAHSFRKSSL